MRCAEADTGGVGLQRTSVLACRSSICIGTAVKGGAAHFNVPGTIAFKDNFGAVWTDEGADPSGQVCLEWR